MALQARPLIEDIGIDCASCATVTWASCRHPTDEIKPGTAAKEIRVIKRPRPAGGMRRVGSEFGDWCAASQPFPGCTGDQTPGELKRLSNPPLNGCLRRWPLPPVAEFAEERASEPYDKGNRSREKDCRDARPSIVLAD